MILHIYHCNDVKFRDYRAAPGRNRPAGTGRYPDRPGEADFQYQPDTSGFDDPALGKLLGAFASIDLANLTSAPIRVNWESLEDTLGLTRTEVRRVVQRADEMGLLRRLTIDYDHEQWLRHSSRKGCLVVMTCVEEADLRRKPRECVDAYCSAVDDVVTSILGKGDSLEQVLVVPNGHLAPRAGSGLPWEEVLALLTRLPPALRKRGYQPHLNSYGYTKVIRLAINAHKLGYVLRVV